MRLQTVLWLFMFTACGASTATSPRATQPVAATTRARNQAVVPDPASTCSEDRSGGMQIEGMLGSLPRSNVQSVLATIEPRLTRCFTRRLETLPCLAGRVGFKVRVGADGAVRWAVPHESTMGDRETEQCMQQEFSALHFQAPCGGEAEVTWSMEMDGGPDARAATPWSPTRIDPTLRQRRAALSACRQGAGTPLAVTLYAAPDGSVAGAGVAIPSPDALAVAECVLREVRAWRLPSPGSWYARATFNVP